MKKFLVFILIAASCTGKDDRKSDEAIVKDLSRATTVIAENNRLHLQKIKKYCTANTSKEDDKKFCATFSNLNQYKETYQSGLQKENADYKKLNSDFNTQCLSELDAAEKKFIENKFKDSPIMDPALLKDLNESTAKHELVLESEIIIEETYKLLLKDFSKRKPGFHWEVYW